MVVVGVVVGVAVAVGVAVGVGVVVAVAVVVGVGVGVVVAVAVGVMTTPKPTITFAHEQTTAGPFQMMFWVGSDCVIVDVPANATNEQIAELAADAWRELGHNVRHIGNGIVEAYESRYTFDV